MSNDITAQEIVEVELQDFLERLGSRAEEFGQSLKEIARSLQGVNLHELVEFYAEEEGLE